MDHFMQFLKNFLTLFIELTVLFILISFLVSWLQRKVTEDKIKRVLDRPNKWSGYLYGTGLGALTPFCSCSTIPILAGLLTSKAPFGPSMSFLIASPLLNPVIIILLWTLLGWELTLYYAVIVGMFSILIGVVWNALGLKESVKEVTVRKIKSEGDSIAASKWKLALQDAWSFFYPLLPFLLIGVFIGAFIHNFIPQDFIVKYAGGDKPWTIPIASVIGIPMYIRGEAILPIADALVSKGMGIGSVIALLIGGAGASIPEVVLLSKLFKKKLVVAFVVSILVVAISTGVIVQVIL
ncbi:permease [Sediminibacillus dalangtanensis]|uniref:Permease n=1 Tax=Sediminibacillus dalangtanensis TaxID=2729421 RepID=A0ABX7VSH3_9BACI|nr:permease [Sediminibacillus dalangtanensis]QTM98413.1 permease [Sediminibacillus dalangtanensis]